MSVISRKRKREREVSGIGRVEGGMEWRRINRALAWEMEPITYIQCCVSSWALYLMDVFALFLDQDKVS